MGGAIGSPRMEVMLIRHGEPEWARDGLTVNNPPLTERGRRQADALADRMADLEVDELWASPLRRAQETAAPVADRLGMPVTTLDWLAEIGAPAWDGTPTDVVARIFADEWTRPLDELWDGLPGGEDFRHFHQRVVTGLGTRIDQAGAVRISDEPPMWKLVEPERRIVVVAHGGTNAVALGYLLGIPPVPWEWERFVSYHASVSVVRPLAISGGHAFSLFRFSDVGHLPPDLQTR
jgi:broad specificity phosphatase PhoE